MARPLSNDKRDTLISATIETVAEQGLSATTALIAKKAGVATGSLFTYFENKEALLNASYLAIKHQIAQAVLPNFPLADLAVRLRHLWNHYIDWGIEHRAARQALQQLEVSTILTESTRQEAKQFFGQMQQMFSQAEANNYFAVPLPFAMRMMEAMVDATIQHILQEPGQREMYKALGFTMMWKAISRVNTSIAPD